MATFIGFTTSDEEAKQEISNRPLCVDLDGTLIHTDLLWESLLLLLRQDFWAVLLVPFWALRGKAFMKHEIAQRIKINLSALPFNKELLSWIDEQRRSGRHIVLATGSNEKLAYEVAHYLGCFDDVLASNASVNLTGDAKRALLVSKFGERQFDYVGNSTADIPIWQHAKTAVVINASRRTASVACKVSESTQIFTPRQFRVKSLLKGARVHQWVKNILVFVPLLTSHHITDVVNLRNSVLLFCAFSFCASVIYIINDLLDLTSDRQHATKSKRPFASGALSIPQGIALGIGFLVLSAAFASLLPLQSQLVLVFYFVLTTLYSVRLKQMLLLDVLTLATLYTVRIIAGAVSTNTKLSHWLIMFSLFLFLSLGICKRSSELMNLLKAQRTRTNGRFYETGDLEPLNICGICSGLLACLVLLLYSTSIQAIHLYATPALLLLLCPLLFYWLSRVWILTFRGHLKEDPILFAMHDRASYVVIFCGIAIILIAEFAKLPINQFLD